MFVYTYPDRSRERVPNYNSQVLSVLHSVNIFRLLLQVRVSPKRLKELFLTSHKQLYPLLDRDAACRGPTSSYPLVGVGV
jgi:hypothetical protein